MLASATWLVAKSICYSRRDCSRVPRSSLADAAANGSSIAPSSAVDSLTSRCWYSRACAIAAAAVASIADCSVAKRPLSCPFSIGAAELEGDYPENLGLTAAATWPDSSSALGCSVRQGFAAKDRISLTAFRHAFPFKATFRGWPCFDFSFWICMLLLWTFS